MIARLAWIVGFLSFALLGFELSLIRILSYAQWYHFAYMIISIALLGFGVSGTLLSLFRSFFMRRARGVRCLCSCLTSVSLALSPALLALVSLDPFLLLWERAQLWHLLLFYLVAFLPFLFGAMVIGLSLVEHPGHAGQIYFFNMVGSGLGSLGAVVLMNWVHPGSLAYLMALMALPAVWLASLDVPKPSFPFIALSALVLLVVIILPSPHIRMSQYKSLSRTLLLPDARTTHTKTTPLGLLEVVESSALRYAPGMSLQYAGGVPPLPGVFIDGEWVGSILGPSDTSALMALEHSTSGLPYRLKHNARVLVVGAGTGSELQLALHSQATSAIGIEMNGALIDLVQSELRKSGLTREHGQLLETEARSHLMRDTTRYDVIVVPILEGFTAAAAGTQALFENYLFTVESFRTLLDRLAPGGLLVVNTWMTFPPRSSVKVMAMMVEALRQSGIQDVRQSFAAFRSWGTFCALARKGPFTDGETAVIREFCGENGFDLVQMPGIRENEVNRYHRLERPVLFEAAQAFLEQKDDEYFDRSLFYVEPPTDNRPYFLHFIKWENLFKLRDLYGSGQVPFFELGFFLLLITLLQLVTVSFAFILLPLIVLRRTSAPKGLFWRTVVYFGGIGLGYMFVEMVMIQKFILFLGHPIYSISAIIATMLIFSGLGSLISARIGTESTRTPRLVFLGVVLSLTLYSFILSPVLRALLPLEFSWRLLICICLLAPLAFLMGFPFPLGLRRLGLESPFLLPWAWGVNGYFSVISASLAVLVAIEVGFVALIMLSVVLYALSSVVSGSSQRSAQVPVSKQ